MIMSGRDARGPEDHDAPLEWRAPSNDAIRSASALVIGRSSIGLQCFCVEGEGTMSPRSIAAFTALILQLFQLCGCTANAAKPSNAAAIEEMERRHEEDMTRMGGGSGM
jgi:hypothetical protein